MLAAATGKPVATQPTAVEPESNLSQLVEEFSALSEVNTVQQMSPPPKPRTSPQSSESMFLSHVPYLRLAYLHQGDVL